MLDIEAIQKILPQRFPFLMIDRIIEAQPRKKVVAIKNVSINEEFFAGHFPGQPIMPGVLLIEAMAQTAIALFADKEAVREQKLAYFLGSVKARFLAPVFPGDQLKITVEPVKMLARLAIVKASVEVAAKEVARAEISVVAKEITPK